MSAVNKENESKERPEAAETGAEKADTFAASNKRLKRLAGDKVILVGCKKTNPFAEHDTFEVSTDLLQENSIVFKTLIGEAKEKAQGEAGSSSGALKLEINVYPKTFEFAIEAMQDPSSITVRKAFNVLEFIEFLQEYKIVILLKSTIQCLVDFIQSLTAGNEKYGSKTTSEEMNDAVRIAVLSKDLGSRGLTKACVDFLSDKICTEGQNGIHLFTSVRMAKLVPFLENEPSILQAFYDRFFDGNPVIFVHESHVYSHFQRAETMIENSQFVRAGSPSVEVIVGEYNASGSRIKQLEFVLSLANKVGVPAFENKEHGMRLFLEFSKEFMACSEPVSWKLKSDVFEFTCAYKENVMHPKTNLHLWKTKFTQDNAPTFFSLDSIKFVPQK